MPTIPNFPQDLMTEHMNWHDPNMVGMPGGRSVPMGAPGSGQEFLSFHRLFLSQFHAWYDNQSFADPAAVAPWPGIPQGLENPAYGWNAELDSEKNRIFSNNPPFASLDEFGRYIEAGSQGDGRGIHGWLHEAVAQATRDPYVGNIATAPMSTYFYEIHGLINSLWT